MRIVEHKIIQSSDSTLELARILRDMDISSNRFKQHDPAANIIIKESKFSEYKIALSIGPGNAYCESKLAQSGIDVVHISLDVEQFRHIVTRKEVAEALGDKHSDQHTYLMSLGIIGEFDVILGSRILQYTSKEEQITIANQTKIHTKENGINLLSAVSTAEEKDLEEMLQSLLRSYGDWEILDYGLKINLGSGTLYIAAKNNTTN